MHAPDTQYGLPELTPLLHVFPHAPQLFGSMELSSHALPHAIWPYGHVHAPF